MSAVNLGRLIVNEFLESTRANPPPAGVTQSAVNTGLLEPLAAAVSRLANSLLAGAIYPENWPVPARELISTVQRQALRFRDQDYFDLADVCRQLTNEDPDGPAGQAAACVLNLLQGADSPVLAAGSRAATSRQPRSGAGKCVRNQHLSTRPLALPAVSKTRFRPGRRLGEINANPDSNGQGRTMITHYTPFEILIELEPDGNYSILADYQGRKRRAVIPASLPGLKKGEIEQAHTWLRQGYFNLTFARDFGDRLFNSLFSGEVLELYRHRTS